MIRNGTMLILWLVALPILAAGDPKTLLASGIQQEEHNQQKAIDNFRYLINEYPTSDEANEALWHLANCLLAGGEYLAAFNSLRACIDENPGSPHFNGALQKEYNVGLKLIELDSGIADKLIPSLTNNDKVIEEIFNHIIQRGPYSKVAPDAQIQLAKFHELRHEYKEAITAYKLFIVRYKDHPQAEEANFRLGLCYGKQAGAVNYDQACAVRALTTLKDYLVKYPKGIYNWEVNDYMGYLGEKVSQHLLEIGHYYEITGAKQSAEIYYKLVIQQYPTSKAAVELRKRDAE